LKAPGTMRLTLKCDELLSSFAFKYNLRRYNKSFFTPGFWTPGFKPQYVPGVKPVIVPGRKG